MKLIIDIGNTCIKAVAMQDATIIDIIRCNHDDSASLSAFASSKPFSRCCWAAVGPITSEFLSFIGSLSMSVSRIETIKTPAPTIKNYAELSPTLGIDRLAVIVAAQAEHPGKNILVVDAGTAITYDFISSDGIYTVGNISAGIGLRLKALNDYTVLLPLVSEDGSLTLSPKSTEDCLRSGAVLGADFEIRGYINHYRSLYPDLIVYLVGGGSRYLPLSNEGTTLSDDYLVTKGIALLGQ